jgi:hypothetical protein
MSKSGIGKDGSFSVSFPDITAIQHTPPNTPRPSGAGSPIIPRYTYEPLLLSLAR